MNYYKLRVSSEPKIIGVRNGIYQAERIKKGLKRPEEYEKVNGFFCSMSYRERENKFPDFDVFIEKVEFLKSAKVTDFVVFSPHMWDCEFMASEKTINLFSKFNISSHKYYDVNLFKQGERINNYKIFHVPTLGYEVIDFEKSTFYSGFEIQKNVKKLKFKSAEEYRNAEYSMSQYADDIVLGDKFDKSLDLFNSPLTGVFISEALKDAILNEGLTGINERHLKESVMHA